VTCVLERPLDSGSRRIGWEQRDPDYGQSEVLYRSVTAGHGATGLTADPNSVHVFSSLAPDPAIREAYRSAVARGRTVGLLSEAREWRGWRGALRRVDSLRHERAWRGNVAFVLAIGSMSRHWYRMCGYDDARIFDFCYVVEPPTHALPSSLAEGPPRLMFVGRLVPGKRVDLLLRAVAALRHRGAVLDVVGAGPVEADLRALCERLRIVDRVRFQGARSNEDVQRMLSTADVLVLPSHWDGWGAVINEALGNGARVVCSDFCGAADLVADGRFGQVFREGSLDSLTEALDALLAMGRISTDERAGIRRYSQTFAGPAVADYLLRVIAYVKDGIGPRPVAPWRSYLDRIGSDDET
jgi:glycosyltransferase involved in cell wall biosynthesis